MNEGRDVGEGGNMEELLGVGQAEKDGIWGFGCHHRETALPDQELSEPSQLPPIILPTSSTTSEEAQLDNYVSI